MRIRIEKKGCTYVVTEGVTGKVLHTPDGANNLRTTKVHTFKAVPIGSTGSNVLFKFSGVTDHVGGLVNIVRGITFRGGKTSQRLLCFFNSAVSNQPPRRFGSEDDTRENERRPHPLKQA